MLAKEVIIEQICTKGIVAVIRATDLEQAVRIADACLEGGINALEMTFTIPEAHKVMETLAKKYQQEQLILGAGTVLDAETARIAILSGAQFIVSPHVNEHVISTSHRYGIACMPGAMTIKEIIEALERGADLIKLFPGELFGPQMIKACHGPLPHAKLMPTGGVDIHNVHQWIEAGAVAVGVGSALTERAKQGDYKSITRLAQQFINKIREARQY